jgi:hypothetical protein
MRRRTLLVALAGLAVVVAAMGIAHAVGTPVAASRLTVDNCYSVKEGMTRTEVEAIFGPPGDYRNGPTQLKKDLPATDRNNKGWAFGFEFGSGTYYLHGGTKVSERWECDTATLEVYFRREPPGTIAVLLYDEANRQEQSLFDNLLWRTKRQWRRWFP